jgi:hypothetical protein
MNSIPPSEFNDFIELGLWFQHQLCTDPGLASDPARLAALSEVAISFLVRSAWAGASGDLQAAPLTDGAAA